MWSGLKHFGTQEYVNVPIVAVADWTTNGGDAGEEPVAVCLVFGVLSHGFPRGCLIHRHRQLVAFELAAVRRVFKGHAGLDQVLSSHVSVPWPPHSDTAQYNQQAMQLKVWRRLSLGSWLIPCHSSPVSCNSHRGSLLIPTFCQLLVPLSLLFSCVTFSRLRSYSHAKCTLLL